MFDRIFLTHPRSIDETYLQHQRVAFGFAGTLFLAACACALHGLAPAFCEKTGSTLVKRLYDRMVAHRRQPAMVSAPSQNAQPWADYAI
jgi:hypothetical protein